MTKDIKTESDYIPGMCNINQAEIKSRRNAGHLGSILTVVAIAAFVYFRVPAVVGLLVFVPAFIAAIGYMQAQKKFCVGFASAGIRSTSSEGLETTEVSDDAALKADKAKARSMNVQSAGIAAFVAVATTILLIVLP